MPDIGWAGNQAAVKMPEGEKGRSRRRVGSRQPGTTSPRALSGPAPLARLRSPGKREEIHLQSREIMTSGATDYSRSAADVFRLNFPAVAADADEPQGRSTLFQLDCSSAYGNFLELDSLRAVMIMQRAGTAETVIFEEPTSANGYPKINGVNRPEASNMKSPLSEGLGTECYFLSKRHHEAAIEKTP